MIVPSIIYIYNYCSTLIHSLPMSLRNIVTILLLLFQSSLSVYPGVGTPTGATVCDGTTATLTCDIRKSGNLSPTWRIFASADTSGQPLASLNSDENSPPYNYPEVQAGDTVARLEVMASLSIDGYHFQCRLPLFTPVDSPKLGNITVITGTVMHLILIQNHRQIIILSKSLLFIPLTCRCSFMSLKCGSCCT